jgi:hypothetical protein
MSGEGNAVSVVSSIGSVKKPKAKAKAKAKSKK